MTMLLLLSGAWTPFPGFTSGDLQSQGRHDDRGDLCRRILFATDERIDSSLRYLALDRLADPVGGQAQFLHAFQYGNANF